MASPTSPPHVGDAWPEVFGKARLTRRRITAHCSSRLPVRGAACRAGRTAAGKGPERARRSCWCEEAPDTRGSAARVPDLCSAVMHLFSAEDLTEAQASARGAESWYAGGLERREGRYNSRSLQPTNVAPPRRGELWDRPASPGQVGILTAYCRASLAAPPLRPRITGQGCACARVQARGTATPRSADVAAFAGSATGAPPHGANVADPRGFRRQRTARLG